MRACVHTSVYISIQPSGANKMLNLPAQAPLILFGCMYDYIFSITPCPWPRPNRLVRTINQICVHVFIPYI